MTIYFCDVCGVQLANIVYRLTLTLAAPSQVIDNMDLCGECGERMRSAAQRNRSHSTAITLARTEQHEALP